MKLGDFEFEFDKLSKEDLLKVAELRLGNQGSKERKELALESINFFFDLIKLRGKIVDHANEVDKFNIRYKNFAHLEHGQLIDVLGLKRLSKEFEIFLKTSQTVSEILVKEAEAFNNKNRS